MQLYMAPMEALTGYIYRNVYIKYFGDADKYFSPFISGKKLSFKEKNEISPDNNKGITLVPQVLTNNADEFIYIANHLNANYGYNEINLNLGCPSGTVVSKNRGSGFLGVLDELESFLDRIFNESRTKISIKTRTGVENSDDFGRIIELYNKYPVSELIIHPRCRVDAYVGPVKLEDFQIAVDNSKHSLCYNGDIKTVEDYNKIMQKFPSIDRVMCGRGLLTNPGLFGEINGKASISKDTIKAFSKDVSDGYVGIMSGDKNVLFKMKELWIYLSKNFEDSDKVLKKLRKAQSVVEFNRIVEGL